MIELLELQRRERLNALAAIDQLHSFGIKTDDNPTGECPTCGNGRRGSTCDHSKAGRKRRRFDMVPWHREELLAALLNPDQRAASAVKERQDAEYHGLPSGHICSCRCRNLDHDRRECDECRRIHANEKPLIPIAIGRTAAVSAPMPDAATLDLLMRTL